MKMHTCLKVGCRNQRIVGRISVKDAFPKSRNKRSLTTVAVQIAEHAAYLEEVAVTKSPKSLPALLRILESKGQRIIPPSDRSRLHPLLIPLAASQEAAQQDASTIGGDAEVVTCLLRWPQPYKNMPLPVVSMSRGARGVKLLGRTPDEYLHRLLVEDEARGSASENLTDLAGPEAADIYSPGRAEAEGFPLPAKLQMYLIRKVGMFPDVCEALAAGHLSRKDTTSALVASEWYSRNQHFPGWGRPYEFSSELFTQLGRREEARDMARAALRMPWWTLQRPWHEVAATACLVGPPDRVHWLLSDEATQAATASVTNVKLAQPKTAQEVSYDAANRLLDLVAGGDKPDYAFITEELAGHYRDAGFKAVADFITSA